MIDHISNQQFEEGIRNNENAVILDVRTPAEWAEGIIPGAVKMNIMDPSFSKEIEKLDREKEYFVYCRSGARSANACGLMQQMGFGEVHNLAGGIMEWNGAVVQDNT